MTDTLNREKTSTKNLRGKGHSYLIFIHHILLVVHLKLLIYHSLKTGNLGIEFWLTLIVNLLLLLDLDKMFTKLKLLWSQFFIYFIK